MSLIAIVFQRIAKRLSQAKREFARSAEIESRVLYNLACTRFDFPLTWLKND